MTYDEEDIIDRLIAEIEGKTYRTNDKLPSENELADIYHVPRITVRKAYERLQQLGYSYSVQGKGYFVRDRQMHIPLVLAGNQSFSKKMQELAVEYETRNLGCDAIDFDPHIFHSLQVSETAQIFEIKRLRIIQQQPIAIHISYVSQTLFPDIATEGHQIKSLFDYFALKGHTTFDATESILKVRFPTKQEREWLQCSSLIPLLMVESGCLAHHSGHVLERSQILYRSDRFQYVI